MWLQIRIEIYTDSTGDIRIVELLLYLPSQIQLLTL